MINLNKILNDILRNPTSMVFTVAVFGLGFYIGQRVLNGNIPISHPIPTPPNTKPKDVLMEDGPYQDALLEPIEEFVDTEGNDAGFGIPQYEYNVAQTPSNANNMMNWDNNETVEVVDYYPPSN